jgi:hypothetical protein
MGSNNPLLLFHRATERAGYPAMLVLSAVCIAIAVPAIALIGMIDTVWALVWAVLNLLAAAAILTLGIYAAMADEEEPVAEGTTARSSSREPAAVVPLRRNPARPERPPGRKAA